MKNRYFKCGTVIFKVNPKSSFFSYWNSDNNRWVCAVNWMPEDDNAECKELTKEQAFLEMV